MKGIFIFIKKLWVDVYDLVPAEWQNKTTDLPVVLVLASTEFVATKVIVSTISLNKHWICTDKFACQGKFPETLKAKIKQRKELQKWKCLKQKLLWTM